ncbi:MAG: undecaprenyldiphospho-muramoylpentapeptide beta-N-acetylglucosaminyltransferase [Bryobacterales bacterium]|nr:undecaprenyldiphospho-muramoylpentapeptide beta-N-acetylglucosaminyltransferase [Bryobacterales bacterium]
MVFVMAGGGTGGHVVPSLAVARELQSRGHDALFIGTQRGLESKLVPAAGFSIEWIDIGGLKRVGLLRAARTAFQLPSSVLRCLQLLGKHSAAAVFSMGGYVAGPVMIAAWLRRIPMILMEPNAMPGMVSRAMGKFVRKALVSFDEAARFFPKGATERTGLPVREAFFQIESRSGGDGFTVLVTGGSRGSQALNAASRAAWPLLREEGVRVRFVLQSGAAQAGGLAAAFAQSGLEGRVTVFIDDMPAAYQEADLVVSRSGAGAVAELAAAGKPSILVPFPFAADDHQRHNAEAMARAGGAVVIPESQFDGRRLSAEIQRFATNPAELARMSAGARSLSRRGAAQRAASLLEELALRH